MDAVKHDLLGLSDFAYERLRSRLDGLTTEEYLWEPVEGCWSVRPGPDGVVRADGAGQRPDPAPFTTIAWRLAHLTDVLAGDRNATWIGVQPSGTFDADPVAATADEAVERLRQAYDRFRTHIANVDSATLTDPMGAVAKTFASSSRGAFILHELDELIHHGAEVAVLRDLYVRRS
jgi:hypothetical protein